MKSLWYTLFLTFALATGTTLSLAGDYTAWHDSRYTFTSNQILYAAPMDTAAVNLDSPVKERVLQDYYFQKAHATKDRTIITAPLPAQSAQLPAAPNSVEAAHISSTDPARAVTDPSTNAVAAKAKAEVPATTPPIKAAASVAEQEATVTIPPAAFDAKANLYITSQILQYRVTSQFVPAHTDWVSRDVTDYYYDKNGHPHSFTRTIDYPEYVPDTYVPHATVHVRFNIYDTKTGNLVFSSEDNRTRTGSSGDLVSIYKRIVDRFFKNLSKLE